MDRYPQEPDELGELSLRESLGVLKENAADYLAVRSELLRIEAKEASHVLSKKIALAVALAVVAIFGYFLFWSLVIFMGGGFLDKQMGADAAISGVGVIALVVLAIHVVAGIVLLKKLTKKPDFELFEMTKAEFKKDKEWLEENS